MNNTQPGILAPVPRLARYLIFSLKPDSEPKKALTDLRELADGEKSGCGHWKASVGCVLRTDYQVPRILVRGTHPTLATLA
jgi:deferrochelatase/peroxidase EfeB